MRETIAEMMARHKPWRVASLRTLPGGVAEVGEHREKTGGESCSPWGSKSIKRDKGKKSRKAEGNWD